MLHHFQSRLCSCCFLGADVGRPDGRASFRPFSCTAWSCWFRGCPPERLQGRDSSNLSLVQSIPHLDLSRTAITVLSVVPSVRELLQASHHDHCQQLSLLSGAMGAAACTRASLSLLACVWPPELCHRESASGERWRSSQQTSF